MSFARNNSLSNTLIQSPSHCFWFTYFDTSILVWGKALNLNSVNFNCITEKANKWKYSYSMKILFMHF